MWTVAEDIAERAIYTTLVEGNTLTTFERVEVVNSTDPAFEYTKYFPNADRAQSDAPNNGSCTWESSYENALEYDFLGSSIERLGAHSGCNYSLELKV